MNLPYLNFERKILLHVFDNHDKVGQLDAEGFSGVSWAGDVRGRHVGTHNLQDEALDVRIGDPFDVP